MKKHYQGILATALLFIASLGTAQAALVALGDYTTDTDTGLDWLDLDLSLGMSLNQVLTQTGTGGTFDGWQVATLGQIHLFMTNAGWIGPYDPSNVSNVGYVANFKVLTTSFLDDPIDDINGFTFDPLSGLGNNHFTDNQTTGITSYSFITPIDPAVGQQGTGTFLVRASVVPLPAAFWLFGAGLAFLLGCAKRECR
jgi:hypothetical protein